MDVMTIYEQLEAEVLPGLKGFQTDLTVHDKRWITNNPGVPFLHFTTETSTDISSLSPLIQDIRVRRVPLEQARYYRNYIGDIGIPEATCRYFDGTVLSTISLDLAVKIALAFVNSKHN